MSRGFLLALTLVVLVAGWPREGVADTIGIGLDWRKNIFVQEYWSEGKPFYAIANKTDTEQTITCVGYRSQAKLAGPWKATAQSVVTVDASALVGKDLVQFNLASGGSLGLLSSPVAPNAFPETPIVSYDGLNGSGGKHADVWVEQQARTFAPGKPVQLKLHIPGDRGEFIVKQGDLPKLTVACDTLRIIPKKNGDFTLDFAKPLKAQGTHTVVLSFTAPEGKSPTMLTVDTWLWARGRKGGHGITRGVVISPDIQ